MVTQGFILRLRNVPRHLRRPDLDEYTRRKLPRVLDHLAGSSGRCERSALSLELLFGRLTNFAIPHCL